MGKRILVIEDDQDIHQLIKMNLTDMHYTVEGCHDGQQGMAMALGQNHDLIVLDIALPEMDGLEICRTLRAQSVHTPILMLTARDSEADRVVGLEMGADDYLTKPFSVRELQARTKAMLRRVDLLQQHSRPKADVMTFKGLTIDVNKRLVSVAEQAVELTSREFELLLFLARQPERVFSREQLLDQVWGYQHSGYEHTVNSHINRLRNKLEQNPAKPKYVLTVWGVGYKFHGN